MAHEITGWIDIPVVQAIEYFSGVLSTFYKWGTHYALAIGTIGLCWSAFKLINSRFSVRDFWWVFRLSETESEYRRETENRQSSTR